MTAASARASRRPPSRAAAALPALPGWGRLLRLELRRNVMPWLLPLAAVLFWYNGYREIMALPPMWNLRAMALQNHLLLDLVIPVTGAAAWTGSRDGRRQITDLLRVTPRPRWDRQLAGWAATTCWAMAGYLCCVAVVYAMTVRQAPSGGPLWWAAPWWPAAVGAAGVPALTALGFAAGSVFPGRFTMPLVTIAAFFGLGFGSQFASGDHSYWQVLPLTAGVPAIGADPGVATFYPYLPDLSVAQVMFAAGIAVALLGGLGLPSGSGGPRLRTAAAVTAAAGLAAAGTAAALAGTGRLDRHGMIVIPALHDAAADRPVRFTPDCGHATAPVCLNPAYRVFRPAVTAALGPILDEVAGLPGAPAGMRQVAEVYQLRPGNDVVVTAEAAGPSAFTLPGPLPGAGGMTSAQFRDEVRMTAGLPVIARVILGSDGRLPAGTRLNQAERAVIAGSLGAGAVAGPDADRTYAWLLPAPGSPAALAARRFAALPAAARHAWLVRHLDALRAGRVSPAQLP